MIHPQQKTEKERGGRERGIKEVEREKGSPVKRTVHVVAHHIGPSEPQQ